MQMFSEHILKEQGWPVTEDASLNFSRVLEVLNKRTGSIYEQGRWCSWGFCSQGFRGYYSAQLLVIMWACIEEGKNPYAMAAAESTKTALLDESAAALFKSLSSLSMEALQRQTLFVCGPKFDLKYERVMRATFGAVALENLGISSDIAPAQTSEGQTVLQVTKRRSNELEDLVFDHVHAGLAALTELRQYKVYLQSSPHQAAALLAECDGGSAEQDTKNSILQAMKLEWGMVTEAENSMKFHRLMQSSCPHTKFVYYREVMSCFEKEGWVLNTSTEAFLRGWFPGLSSSCNVEQCFNHMEDSIKRASKANTASLANVQCLGIRAVANKICKGEKAAQAVNLSPEDFEGNEVRAIKPKVWRADTYINSTSAYSKLQLQRNAVEN
ncbi:hemA [Symbiodinium sp. CCMP2592]|nr:hemA [Symbiodinium sp. CCMP2592]